MAKKYLIIILILSCSFQPKLNPEEFISEANYLLLNSNLDFLTCELISLDTNITKTSLHNDSEILYSKERFINKEEDSFYIKHYLENYPFQFLILLSKKNGANESIETDLNGEDRNLLQKYKITDFPNHKLFPQKIEWLNFEMNYLYEYTLNENTLEVITQATVDGKRRFTQIKKIKKNLNGYSSIFYIDKKIKEKRKLEIVKNNGVQLTICKFQKNKITEEFEFKIEYLPTSRKISKTTSLNRKAMTYYSDTVLWNNSEAKIHRKAKI
jgi:hypothetical protein